MLEMANRKACALHGGFEGERATKKKSDEVLPPQVSDLRWLLDQHAPAIDAVSRHVGAEVGSRSNMARVPGAGLGHVHDWAGLGIALAEAEEIKRQIVGHDDEVRLQIIRRETAGCTRQSARSCLGSNIRAPKRAGVHFTSLSTAACRSRSASAMPASGTIANRTSPLRKFPLAPLRRPIA